MGTRVGDSVGARVGTEVGTLEGSAVGASVARSYTVEEKIKSGKIGRVAPKAPSVTEIAVCFPPASVC